jgi:trimeric autotransporter adhesin
MRIAVRVLAFAVLACGIGPNGNSLGPPPASVVVSPDSAVLDAGASLQLYATALDAAGDTLRGRHATWRSLDPTIAIVDANGLVHGQLAGQTTVQAVVENETGSAQIRVRPRPVATVDVTPADSRLLPRDTSRITATPRDGQGLRLIGRQAVWAIADTTIATVDSTGLVLARRVGVTSITATVDTVVGHASVHVLVPVAAIHLSPDSVSLPFDGTIRLQAVFLDSLGDTLTDRTASWSSDDSTVAVVLPQGDVIGIGPGGATIVASVREMQATAAVHVSALRLVTVVAGALHSCGLTLGGVA